MMRDEGGRRWQPWALALVCGLAAVLYGWAIWSSGYGNPYYAAAVRSMSESWRAFLFGSFDPVGVVTIDKPPLAFWAQVVSVKVLGFHGWSVLLPQAFEGVAAVFLLHRAVRRWAGENVALVAALALAVTPITVAVARDDLPDTLMVLWLVAAAYALTRAVEAGSTGWLLLSALFVGCGFTTKMTEAWVVAPALGLAFLAGSAAPWGRRLLQLAGAGAVMLVSSSWWVALVDLWPGPKPYIGSSSNGTALSLVIGWNGIGRILGQKAAQGQPGGELTTFLGLLVGGIPGPQRLFNSQVGGQISWLLPLSLLTLVVVGVTAFRSRRAGRRSSPVERAGWVMWGGWLLVGSAVLSATLGAFHPYYAAMLAPAVAAVAAAGLDRFWRAHREAGGRGWVLLPLGVGLTALWAFVMVQRDPAWNGWVGYAVLGLAAVAICVVVAPRLGRVPAGPLARPAAVLVLAAILLGPATWSAAAGFGPSHALLGPANPTAGPFVMPPVLSYLPAKERPAVEGVVASLQPSGSLDVFGGDLTPGQRRLLAYVQARAGRARIALAVEGGAIFAAPYMIAADRDVIGMGGFMGSDPVPTADQLAAWRAQGQLRFVLAGAPGSGRGGFDLAQIMGGQAAAGRERWVRSTCRVVPAGAYGGAATGRRAGVDMLAGEALYDCGGG